MDLNILTIIIGITVIISLLAFNNRSMLERFMFMPYDVKHHRNYKRYVTHLFIHADIGHLAFNMFSLYFLGDLLLSGGTGEMNYLDSGLTQSYGAVKGQIHFFILYFAGGIAATIIPYMRHQDNMVYRSLGASGAVSAVIFASILWYPAVKLQLLFIPIPIPAWAFGLIYLAIEYFMDRRGQGNVAHDAHIGGALFGILYVLIINIDKGKEFFLTIFG